MAEAVVELLSVGKDYGTGRAALPVLDGIDFRVETGELVGLVGASGSGKTTLLNILGCMDRPSRGTYRLHGRDVSVLDDASLSRLRNASIGFVFQSFNLISQLTVLENVEVPLFYARQPRRRRHERSRERLESVGLGHRLGHLPSQLSGGERQRVAIARALVTDPVLLLADEPTGNLDSRSGEEVLQLFEDLHTSGRTIIIVTHNREIADGLPRVVEMSDGAIVAREAPASTRAVAPDRGGS